MTLKQTPGFLYRTPFYLLLLGVYPVLFLWMENFTQTLPFVLPRSLLFSMGITILVSLVCWIAIKEINRAAAVAGLSIGLFFSYGHFQIAAVLGSTYNHYRYTLPLWIAFFLFGVFIILRTKSHFYNFTWAVNTVSAFLVLLTLVQIGYFSLRTASISQPDDHAQSTPAVSDPSSPDIYYIILDGYAREDLLKEFFAFDNHPFITQIESLGFVVPQCTQSNYGNTIYSMTATFNMDYLDKQGFSYSKLAASRDENGYKSELTPALHANRVMEQLKAAGYQIITFTTPYPFVNFPDSDLVVDAEKTTSQFNKLETLNFQYWLLRTTLLLPLVDRAASNPGMLNQIPPFLLNFVDPRDGQSSSRIYKQFVQNTYALDSLAKIPNIPGKKFIYAHLLTTHPPFTYTVNGEFLTASLDFKEAYKDQILYADQALIQIIKTIITQSRVPPIIILQGDHAILYNNDYYRILNAYYLPGNGKDALYPSITPVNTFRLILNRYFKDDLALLPDQTVEINSRDPNGYKLVPQTCVD